MHWPPTNPYLNLKLWVSWSMKTCFPVPVLQLDHEIYDLIQSLVTTTTKSLQLCPTLCDPIDGSPLGSPVLGFSRQEHWSGLPFPSPMHESEKWKWSHSVVSDPQRPHELQPTRLLHPWNFSGRSTGVECHCLLQELSYYLQNWK